MSKKYTGPSQYRPVSAWGYIGYNILYGIPVIGWIFLLVFAFHPGNINRRSYARYHLLCFLIGLCLLFITGTLLYNYMPGFKGFMEGCVSAFQTGNGAAYLNDSFRGTTLPSYTPAP